MKSLKSIIFVFLCCAVTIVSCRQKQPMAAGGEYSTMIVSTADRELSTSYSASVKGKQDIEIYPQVSGRLTKLHVTEGETVKKGQVLFVIDQVPYEAALKVAEANVKAAEAALATERLNYESKQELHKQGVVSEFDLQSSYNSLLSAEAALAQAEALKTSAHNDLSYTTVTSPSDGVIGTLPYRQGALVSSNIAQPLTTVSDNSRMYVYFSIDENKLLELGREYGDLAKAAEQMPEIQLRLSDGTVYPEKGRVESISGVINNSTGTVSLRAVFPNPGKFLHSGGKGSVIMPAKYNDCIVIPQAATFELQDKIFVYKIIDGATKSAMINVSSINDGKEYIVTDGLIVGDEIIKEGAGLLRDGISIKGGMAGGSMPPM